MAGIEILIDAQSFERAADGHVAREILPRLVRALNDVAAAAKIDVVDAIKTELDNPSPFTVSGVAVFKAKPSANRDPDAVVFIRDRQAEYLDLIVNTGVRRAGDPATTRLGPLIPGKDAKLNAQGNLPRGYVARQLRKKNVAWVTLTPGQPPALVENTKSGLKVLALIVREAHYDKVHLPFFDIVEQAVSREWPKAAARALERAASAT